MRQSLLQIQARGDEMEKSAAEKDKGVLVEKKLVMSQQCALAVQIANCILDYMKRSVASRSKKAISSTLLSQDSA